MIKQFTPSQPDGIATVFALPERYKFDTPITLFVNGQLLKVQDDLEHPYGYFLDSHAKIFTFYTPPEADDFLYIMYDEEDPRELNFDNIDWTKKVKSVDFTTSVIKEDWDSSVQKIQWETKPTKIYWDMSGRKFEWQIEVKSIEFKYRSCTSS